VRASRRLILLSVLILITVIRAHATTVIEPNDEKSVFVTVSGKDINRIEMPEPVIEALSSKAIDVKVKDRNIFVKLTDSHPAELFISTQKRTISLILVPKDIPAETILIRAKENNLSSSSNLSVDDSYEDAIKKVVVSLDKETVPPGYIEIRPKNVEQTLGGLSARKVYEIQGSVFGGERYEIKNTGSSDVSLSEEMFYKEGILAVSLDKYALSPNETCRLFIVKRTKHET
jgi:conjugal transfer pilus assembly protein TraK